MSNTPTKEQEELREKVVRAYMASAVMSSFDQQMDVLTQEMNKLINSEVTSVLDRLEKEWMWMNYAPPNSDTDDYKAVTLAEIEAERSKYAD